MENIEKYQFSVHLEDICEKGFLPLVRSQSSSTICSSDISENPSTKIKDEDCSIEQLLNRIRNVINYKKSNKPYLPNGPKERGNHLLDLLEDKLKNNSASELITAIFPFTTDRAIQTTHQVPNASSVVDNSHLNEQEKKVKASQSKENPFNKDQLEELAHTGVQTSPAHIQVQSTAQQIQIPSYAQVTENKAKKLHTILLYPKEDQEKPQPIRNLLQSELNQRKEGIKIAATRPIRKNGLAIDCTSQKDLQNFLDKLNAKESLAKTIDIKQPSKRYPRCVIYDIREGTSDEEVLQALAMETDTDTDKFKVSFKLRGKEGRNHFVISAPPQLIQELITLRKISLNWQKHNIREHFDIKRCFKCQDFGHIQTNCKRKNVYCVYCGNSHPSSTCRNNRAQCLNCSEANRNRRVKYDINHFASDNKCPVYQQMVQRYKDSLTYE
ncbi:hypothetical protein AVEN_92269-1 [Araneus ventricosus]|uniref:CCHC-type domain-containing protein n=1 Tax=Araneus ventricosus TaxID=182803 RepID=A0A4Y2AM84_ARAVE|nr:hypothetical protein AVEN_92269-1 [Araneus ventricosus]